jgi:Phage tail lysozyme
LTQRQQAAFRLFVAAGYAPAGAAVIVGGDSQESGVNLVSGYQATTDHGSQGIAQWRVERLAALEQFCSANHLGSGTLAAQVSFQIYELGKDYALLDKRLRAGSEPLANLASSLCFQYERPAVAAANLPNRIKQAQVTLRDAQAATPGHAAVVIGAGAVAAGAHHFAGAGKMVMALIIGAVVLSVLIALFNRWRAGHAINLDALSAAIQQMQISQAAAMAAQNAAVAAASAKEKAIAADQAALAAARATINQLQAGVVPAPVSRALASASIQASGIDPLHPLKL